MRDFAHLLWKIYLNEYKKQNMSNNSLLIHTTGNNLSGVAVQFATQLGANATL